MRHSHLVRWPVDELGYCGAALGDHLHGAPADGAASTVEVVDEHAGKHPAFQMLMGKIQIMRLKLLIQASATVWLLLQQLVQLYFC